jgi:hypothetical protein
MRQILSVLGIIFVVVVLVGIVFVGISAYEGNSLDKSSKAYVEQTVKAIFSTWSKEELTKDASPQLAEFIEQHPGAIDRLFQKSSTLGALRDLGDPEGHADVLYTRGTDKQVTARYVVNARFQNGNAVIVVNAIEVPNGWALLLLDIKPQ